jgi:hypothetical protein
MKKILFAICLSLLLVGCSSLNKDQLTDLDYSFNDENGIYHTYVINKTSGKYVLTYSKGEAGDALVQMHTLKDSDVRKLEDLIKKHGIDKWDGFNEVNTGELDGSNFTLEIVYSSGESIKAEGFMKFPDNYDEGHEALVDFLNDLVE